MATIFRGKVVTAIAVLSTTVAINAQPAIQNRILLQPPPRSLKDFPNPAKPQQLTPFVHDVRNRLVLLPVPPPPPNTLRDWPTPSPPKFPFVHDVRNRHVFLPAPNPTPPFAQSDWPTTLAPIRSVIADAILNEAVRLPQIVPASPFPFLHDDALPLAPVRFPHGLPHRPRFTQGLQPPFTTETFFRAPRLISAPTDPVRNGIVLPVAVVGTPFYKHLEWPNPARLALKPETFLFYYIQDQTSPAFIQYDWPKAPKLPSLVADPIPNRLLFPFVAPPPPFHQHDWPNASIRQIAKIGDPYNRNVFLPVPQGQPTHQHDWPLPQGALSLLGSHTINDLGILSVAVVKPLVPVEWPLPRAAGRPSEQHWLGVFVPRFPLPVVPGTPGTTPVITWNGERITLVSWNAEGVTYGSFAGSRIVVSWNGEVVTVTTWNGETTVFTSY